MLGAFLLFVCNRIFVVSFFGVRAREAETFSAIFDEVTTCSRLPSPRPC
jgi:hypothetical protein